MAKTIICLIILVSAFTSLSGQIERNDIVINEVLFNPPRDGFDYLEIFNRSNKTIDLEHLMIGKRNSSGDPSAIKVLSGTPSFLVPGSYAVITANEKWLMQHYHVGEESIVCQISPMPSFPDDSGNVIIISRYDSSIIDELSYNESWHFPLIRDKSGVSLERINAGNKTQDRNNWTSASSSSGFGTPGSKNSQSRSDTIDNGDIVIKPDIFSPDNDGVDDFADIQYKKNEPGDVVNLFIYDLSGRRVRYLLRNEYLGLMAQYKWDGLDDQSRPLPQGIYIMVSELFNLKGRMKKFKKMITLARRV